MTTRFYALLIIVTVAIAIIVALTACGHSEPQLSNKQRIDQLDRESIERGEGGYQGGGENAP